MDRLLGWSEKFAEKAGEDIDLSDVAATYATAATDGACIVALHDHGFICGGLVAPWFNRKKVYAEELIWFAEKGGLALLKHFEAWAAEVGAHGVVMAHLSDERVGRLYERRGYVPKDTKYVRSF